MVAVIQQDSSGGRRASVDVCHGFCRRVTPPPHTLTAVLKLFLSPHTKSLSSASSSSGSNPPTPRLEIDKLDTSPFSVSANAISHYVHVLIVIFQECFSAWFDDDEPHLSPTICSTSPHMSSPPCNGHRVVNPDLSYDIEVRQVACQSLFFSSISVAFYQC
jgi:hypothetical protein